jgi:hypothetical protein
MEVVKPKSKSKKKKKSRQVKGDIPSIEQDETRILKEVTAL